MCCRFFLEITNRSTTGKPRAVKNNFDNDIIVSTLLRGIYKFKKYCNEELVYGIAQRRCIEQINSDLIRFFVIKLFSYIYVILFYKFQKETLSYGTTTACYFASLYVDSSLILANTAMQLGQRALIGKINMITFAPTDYVETAEESLANTLSFIESIKQLKVLIIHYLMLSIWISHNCFILERPYLSSDYTKVRAKRGYGIHEAIKCLSQRGRLTHSGV